MNEPIEENPGSITSDLESLVSYTQATTGQRFLNWLVDNLLMRYGLSYLTGMLAGYILQYIAPEFLYRIAYEPESFDLVLLAYIIGIINYLFYYTICEKAFKRYTLGKLLTGTRAIREDGEELTFKAACLRSLIRLIPFEVFSAFGNGKLWHDAWTKTVVVKTR